ncbi:thioredoxin-like protein [Heterostelium album PN500]|uniref:Thioredoxin-like protein n=1 Tax=Heterostelium pallidum (strain ATCC 26659 / Pp 5 / PN500) TaxID=670386 RepID=D3BH63_HETP5|nr:thioredoxin-like protein [Heterostelium album PN500]EFA79447.1 thioredoxin-like protein [Heterostelium album PN500]|eukprot:XP_020431568.1 thioredoxin-like protein [Heterostelium album PN500]
MGYKLILTLVLVITILSIHISAHDSATAPVIHDLQSNNIDQYLSKGIWMLCFYAPWCKHSKAFEPIFNELATLLKGHINFARVDCISDPAMLHRFGVVAYPTIKLLFDGKLYEYGGERTIPAVIHFLQYGYQQVTPVDFPNLITPDLTPEQRIMNAPNEPHDHHEDEKPKPPKAPEAPQNNPPSSNNNYNIPKSMGQSWIDPSDWKDSKLLYCVLGGMVTACGLMIKKRLTKKSKFMKIA